MTIFHSRLPLLSVLILPVILSVTSPVYAQQIRTVTDKDSVTVGDVFSYSIILEKGDAESTGDYPGREDFDNEAVSYLSRELFRVAASRDSVVYRLQFFGIDDYEIPELNVELSSDNGLSTNLQTNPVMLYFTSSVAEGDNEFRPLKPIFDFGRSFWPWLIALVIIALAGWFFYRWWFSREILAHPEPLISLQPYIHPAGTLKKELDKLSGSDSPLLKRDFKEFYARLGDAIRLYFEEVYNIKALEMTSREILSSLRDYPADRQVIEITKKVLNEADVVKFANYNPDSDQAKSALNIAYRFADIVGEIDYNRIERKREQFEYDQLRKRELHFNENKTV